MWMQKDTQQMYAYIWPCVINMETISLGISFQLLTSG